jgi:hypothetical protein
MSVILKVVEGIISKIPHVFWKDFAQSLVYEICTTEYYDDSGQKRYPKVEILNHVKTFLDYVQPSPDDFKENFQKDLTTQFAEHLYPPMKSFYANEYLCVCLLLIILNPNKSDIDNSIDNEHELSKVLGKSIFTNVLLIVIKDIVEDPKNKDISASELSKMVFDGFSNYLKLPTNTTQVVSNHTGGKNGNNPLDVLKTDIHEQAITNAAKIYPKLDDMNPLQNIGNLTNTFTKDINSLKSKAVDVADDLKGKAVDVADDLKGKAVDSLKDQIGDASKKIEKIVTDNTADITSNIDKQLTDGINSQISKIPIGDKQITEALKIKDMGELKGIVSNFKTFDLQEKIVEKVEKYFTTKTNGNLTEMREVFYKQIVDAITYHLQSPEGRQIFLRMIEPLILLFAQQFILTGEIEIITIIHLVSHSNIIKQLLNEALLESISNPLNSNDITIRTVTAFYKKLEEHKNRINPLKELYEKMQNLTEPIPKAIINKKIKLDYNKTLCSSANDIQKQIAKRHGGSLLRKSKKHKKSYRKKNKKQNITKKMKSKK